MAFLGGEVARNAKMKDDREEWLGVEGHPAGGWDRTALCTSNVCHSRKLMMPRFEPTIPLAVCEKRDRQRVKTEGGVVGTWMQWEEVRRSHEVRWGCGMWVKIQEYLGQSTPQLAQLNGFEINYIPSFQLHCCLLPSSASFIESSYLLRFMRSSANFIWSQSPGCYLIFQCEKGGWGWAFWLLGWNCYHLQPVREHQFREYKRNGGGMGVEEWQDAEER